MSEKTKGQSKMDNPEKPTIPGTQDTRWRQTKQKTQHRKPKSTTDPQAPAKCKQSRTITSHFKPSNTQ